MARTQWPCVFPRHECHMVWSLDEVRREHTCTKSVKRGIDTVQKTTRGRRKFTWIELMRKQLQEINLTWEEASHLAKDHEKWKDILKRKNVTR